MITTLKIQNIFPFKKLDITFDEGLNILTGESGSGKSALISSIALLLGEKADKKMIRPGEEIAFVEGSFNLIQKNSEIFLDKLESVDIVFEKDSSIVIRREINIRNKTRAFINDQLIPLSTLQEIGPFLMECVSQNAHQELLSKSAQREMIDLFGNIKPHVESFSQQYRKMLQLSSELIELEEKKDKAASQKDYYTSSLEEILNAAIEKDEEKHLTDQHHLLAHAQEIKEHTENLHYQLSDSPQSLNAQMESVSKTIENLHQKDPSLSEMMELSKTLQIEMQELTYQIRHYLGTVEPDPEKLFQIEDRLKTIEEVKKQHGNDFDEIEKKKEFYQNGIDEIDSYDSDIEELKTTLEKLETSLEKEASIISDKRKKASAAFEKSVTNELKTLNMPSVMFHIAVEKKARSSFGDDQIQFFFSANKGTKAEPLKGIASGGELSRLLLAMKLVIGEKEKNKPLLFDEIDSNVGGKSANIIGEKLHHLGSMRQILCITHFVQVAKHGHSHFYLRKMEDKNGTKATIQKLLQKAKETEYSRMIGLSSEE